jgi:RAD51-like protein 2
MVVLSTGSSSGNGNGALFFVSFPCILDAYSIDNIDIDIDIYTSIYLLYPVHTMPTTPSIALSELPLRPSTLSLLTRRGFVSTKELEESRKSGMATLAAELGNVPLQEAANLLREVQGCLSQQEEEEILTAHDLINQNVHHRNHIVTFAKQVDQLLGGGIALGQLTEIAGMPGTAKTQLAMQLCVLCRLPRVFGGVEGRALYIDTEGSFAPERCHQMADALVKHVSQRHSSSSSSSSISSSSSSSTTTLTSQEILESIQVFRVHDETSQTATLRNLINYLPPNNSSRSSSNNTDLLPVKLIVLDSIAFHYRAITPTDHKYYLQRTKALVSLAAFLSDLARTHHLAVVCINQMTTKLSNAKTLLVPALGESWAHAVTTRLLLSQQQQQQQSNFTCQMVKSPHKPAGIAQFQVLPQGIRGLSSTNNNNPTNHSSSNINSSTTSNNSSINSNPTIPHPTGTISRQREPPPPPPTLRAVTPHPPLSNTEPHKRRRTQH